MNKETIATGYCCNMLVNVYFIFMFCYGFRHFGPKRNVTKTPNQTIPLHNGQIVVKLFMILAY